MIGSHTCNYLKMTNNIIFLHFNQLSIDEVASTLWTNWSLQFMAMYASLQAKQCVTTVIKAV